jgi:subtilisin family serine protease
VAAGNGGGVTGTAPDATFVFLKVQHAAQCGQRSLGGDFVAAIDWAVTHQTQYNIKIISMSFGGGAYSSIAECDNDDPAFRDAINAAHAAGISVFAAAGNEGQVGFLASPACLSNVISVGATYDADIGPAIFSNCADDFTDADLVTCYSNSAKFLNVLAPSHCAQTARAGGGIYHCFGGTSSATPFSAGVAAALLEAASGNLNHDQMRQLLANTGVELLDAKSNLSTPRIDAQAALQALMGGELDGPCTACDHYAGTLSGPGAYEVQPNGRFYFSNAGMQQGWLEGPAGTDFDLSLYQWVAGEWVLVAQSLSDTSSEAISYSGSDGVYAWVVASYSGSGSYDFWLKQPGASSGNLVSRGQAQ